MTRRGYDACPPANVNPRRRQRDAARRAAALGKWRTTATGLWELSTAGGAAAVLKVHEGCWVVSVSETGAETHSAGEFKRLRDAKRAAVDTLSVLAASVKRPSTVPIKASGRLSTADMGTPEPVCGGCQKRNGCVVLFTTYTGNAQICRDCLKKALDMVGGPDADGTADQTTCSR